MLLGLLGLLTPSVLAFAPTDSTWIGVEPARVVRVHPARQARLATRQGWARFTEGEGFGWRARFDERTATPLRAWGPGIDLGPLATSKDAEGALRGFFARNPSLLGVELGQLPLRSANYVARTDTWYVDFDRVVDGAPIWRGGVTARIKLGKLVMVGVATYPELQGVEPATVAMADAITSAELDGPAALADHSEESARLVILPREESGGLRYRLVWEVRSRTVAPLGKWVSHVDADTGELLNVYNEVRFVDGVLSATHDTRTVDGSFTTSGVPLAYLTGATSGTSVTTGIDGAFGIDVNESWTTRFRGDYVQIRNQGGSDASLAFTGTSPTWSSSNADLAEIDSYVFLHHVRDWGLEFAPEVAMVTDAQRSNVNLRETCNAYWNGDLNFYQAGDGCNNTGRIADVNYHEWGHGFHYYSLESGVFDGSISEGIGDVVSMLQTLDPTIAPYFGTNGGAIRELETDYVYPRDLTGEVHQDGLIFAGAVWDLYTVLSDTYGEPQGVKGTAWAVTSQLFADAIKAGPTIDESFDEFALADDDDGNLSNGTPHLCELVEAFGRHGLGLSVSEGAFVTIEHAALGNQPAFVDLPIDGAVSFPACVDFTAADAEVVYSTDDGDTWDTAPLALVGDRVEGAIPAQPAGTVVSYYLYAEGEDGSEVTAPVGGEIAPYTFFVGQLEEIYCEPFADDGGYEHELLAGSDRGGGDDWTFDSPGGYADDPYEAYTGSSIWGNNLGGDEYEGEYHSNIVNRLTSPPIDLGGATPIVVQYRRWLNVEDGVYDKARVYMNDTEVWSNYETNSRDGTAHTQDGEWMLHTILVEPDADSVSLGWEIDTDQGLEFGGWNIDDVCVYRIAASPLVISDFVASDGLSERVELSWTQPSDPAATDATVVRRDDRFPADRTDGEVVWSGPASPGGVVTATDASAGGYYAVYAGGDDGWMTGAVEGQNADVGSAVDEDGDGLYDGGPDGGVELHGGCGCATGGAPTGLAVALAAGLLALVRRRRA